MHLYQRCYVNSIGFSGISGSRRLMGAFLFCIKQKLNSIYFYEQVFLKGGIGIYINRYHLGNKRQGFIKLVCLLVICTFSIFLVITVLNLPFLVPAAKVLAVDGLSRIMQWGDWSGQDIIRLAMPVLAWQEVDAAAVQPPSALLISFMSVLARVDMHSPRSLLQSQLPLMESSALPPGKPAVLEAGPASPVANKVITNVNNNFMYLSLAENQGHQAGIPFYYGSSGDDKALVALYNTHTSETYKLTDGVEHLAGQRGGVVKVAHSLENALMKDYGICVVRSDKIHDIEYNTSYVKSEKTACALIEKNPELEAIFDIHRDMEKPRKQCVIKVNNKNAATILIVVGSDSQLPHPQWEKNLGFAKEIEKSMNSKYPGLCIGVRVYDGRYHQHLHQHALLLEIGGVNNTVEEACYSAELLAEVLAEIIKNGQ